MRRSERRTATGGGRPHPACSWLRSAPGPVPVGGLRIPSSKSLSTTALLCFSFFEANRSVRRFLLWARAIEFLQIFFGLGTSQLFQVTLAEEQPSFRLGVKPLSQFVRGSKIAQPLVHGDFGFRKPRGHRRSTRTRAPSERDTDSYTRFTATGMALRLSSIIVSRANCGGCGKLGTNGDAR